MKKIIFNLVPMLPFLLAPFTILAVEKDQKKEIVTCSAIYEGVDDKGEYAIAKGPIAKSEVKRDEDGEFDIQPSSAEDAYFGVYMESFGGSEGLYSFEISIENKVDSIGDNVGYFKGSIIIPAATLGVRGFQTLSLSDLKGVNIKNTEGKNIKAKEIYVACSSRVTH